ncbi:MAG: DUF4159 domain-containing protein [Planctomycetes bacterium]|nr:DUF4159 domain-containing protein [Planctomycetota bacterium]
MMCRTWWQTGTAWILLCVVGGSWASSAFSADITAREVVDSIERAKQAILSAQNPEGSWALPGDQHVIGDSSLALLALLNAGVPLNDPKVDKGLTWLRNQPSPTLTYEISLMIQVFAAAKDGKRDLPRVTELANTLVNSQVRGGPNVGSWTYNQGMGGIALGDRSNAQFAVLGLREAQEMGVAIPLEVWKKARHHWISTQNGDGSWSYNTPKNQGGGTGSMTVAGIATLVITEAMVRMGEKELKADGTPNCCGDPEIDKPLEDACAWLGRNFAVRVNPNDGRWLLYYLYGLERAGRFSGKRFFVNSRGQKHDWYRAGAAHLIATQQQFLGTWKDGESAVRSTSFALLFLSKGLAPVLINKLQHGPQDGRRRDLASLDWNRHPSDIRNLTQHISNLPKWPKLLVWQTVELAHADLADLMQAPILYISGSEAPQFTPQDLELFKEYVLQGGFILIDNNCRSAAFDDAVRDLVRQMYPPSETQLKKLTADHPVYRSEYNLVDPESGTPSVELWGVDVGCRTSIIYSPHDLSCLWDKITSFKVPNRPQSLVSMIDKATRVGVNIVAYVTGREILKKLEQQEQALIESEPDRVERDILEIKKIRYTGDWDAAPQALKNLLTALNRTTGATVTTNPRNLQILDPKLFQTSMVYMHGRNDFNLNRNELEMLRKYIDQGGVLFADACCGTPGFDRSFRTLVKQLFPDQPLKRIPIDHEMFSAKLGHDLKTVKRREPDATPGNTAVQVAVRQVEPFLEGIEINGRYVIVYSKYDISCALERQASVACTGYIHEDAVRIGVNIVLYFLNQ